MLSTTTGIQMEQKSNTKTQNTSARLSTNEVFLDKALASPVDTAHLNNSREIAWRQPLLITFINQNLLAGRTF